MKQHTSAFFELLRVGLWGKEPELDLFSSQEMEWEKVFSVALSQTMMGVLMDGIRKLPRELQPPRRMLVNLVKMVAEIEDKNSKMNVLVPKLMNKLEENGCHVLLLKGQGAAMNYPHPEHRQPGDIDLFVGFDDADNDKANKIIADLASYAGPNNRKRKHAEYRVKDTDVEVHGNVSCVVNKQLETQYPLWARERLAMPPVTFRSRFGNISIPHRNFDAIYIFTHMFNHFMGGGVGLRQVCDWMMLLHKNREKIDMEMLKADVKRLGIEKPWRVFASLCVIYLGCPKDSMPLYDTAYDKKARRAMSHIFKTGNFGTLQKDKQLSSDSNKWVKKFVTFLGQLPVYADVLPQFPQETVYCFKKFVIRGAELD